MNLLGHLLPALLLAGFAYTLPAEAGKDKKVYAFVFGTSLKDSTVYLSMPNVVPEAKIDSKTGFLTYRRAYSEQFKSHLDHQFGSSHTCSVFFATSAKAIEKQFIKVRKLYQDRKKGKKLVELPLTAFELKAVTPEEM